MITNRLIFGYRGLEKNTASWLAAHTASFKSSAPRHFWQGADDLNERTTERNRLQVSDKDIAHIVSRHLRCPAAHEFADHHAFSIGQLVQVTPVV